MLEWSEYARSAWLGCCYHHPTRWAAPQQSLLLNQPLAKLRDDGFNSLTMAGAIFLRREFLEIALNQGLSDLLRVKWTGIPPLLFDPTTCSIPCARAMYSMTSVPQQCFSSLRTFVGEHLLPRSLWDRIARENYWGTHTICERRVCQNPPDTR